jgi:hypothetical protein
MSQETFVHARHRFFAYNRDADFKVVLREFVDQKCPQNVTKKFCIERLRALAIAHNQNPAHGSSLSL